MLSNSMIAARFDRTEAMLDAHYPGWDTINPDKVDIEFCNTCILGRHAGDYNVQQATFAGRGITSADIVGIFAKPGRYQKQRYAARTAYWRRRIRERQAARSDAPLLLASS